MKRVDKFKKSKMLFLLPALALVMGGSLSLVHNESVCSYAPQTSVKSRLLPKTSVSVRSNECFLSVPFGTYLDVSGDSFVVEEGIFQQVPVLYGYLDSVEADVISIVEYDEDDDSIYVSFSGNLFGSTDYDQFLLTINGEASFLFPNSLTDSDVFVPQPLGQLIVNVNVTPASGVDIVHDIVEILGAGITNLGAAIGQGISATAQAMFFNQAGTDLSVWGIVVLAFAGVGLAIGLTRLVYGFITTLSGRK